MTHGLAAGLGLWAVLALAQLLTPPAPRLLRPQHCIPAGGRLVREEQGEGDSDEEAAWWLEQRRRKALVAATCARLGAGRPAAKDDLMYARDHQLLYCRNAKVAGPSASNH